MTDIVALVRAEQARIQELFWTVLAGTNDRTGPDLAWWELADLLSAHVTAAEEICHLELIRVGQDPRRHAEAQADRDDALEALDEAMLCRPDSPRWEQLVLSAHRASSAYFRWLDSGLAELQDRLDARAGEQLASQWRAFRRAWARDGDWREEAMFLPNRQLSGVAIRHR